MFENNKYSDNNNNNNTNYSTGTGTGNIQFDSVDFSYPNGMRAIKGMSFSISSGEYVAVTGKNASGKSTIAALLNGMCIPDKGEVWCFGFNTKRNKTEVQRRVGRIFQNPDNRMVCSDVKDEMAFGAENLGVLPGEIAFRIDETVTKLHMEDIVNKMTDKLSGGEKQKVAIAGLLVMKPDCIVLDEAISMADPFTHNELIKILKKLNEEENITIINITHCMKDIMEADRVLIINDGGIAEQGTPEEIFGDLEKIEKYRIRLPAILELAYRLKNKGVPLEYEGIDIKKISEGLIKLFFRV